MTSFPAGKTGICPTVTLSPADNPEAYIAHSNEQIDARSTVPWQAHFLRRLPWDAFVSLFIGIGCAIFIILVIVMANGDPIDNWRVAPSVYLAISSVVANIVLRYAFNRGVEISWWAAALRENRTTTIADLHHIWSFSTSLRSALLAGRSFNFVALASILLTLVPANAPLAQRALHTVTRPTTVNIQVPIVAAPFLNDSIGATGVITGRSSVISTITPAFAPILQHYLLSTPMLIESSACQGAKTCRGILQAAGYKMVCVNGREFFDKSPRLPDDIAEDGNSAFNESVMFSTDFDYMPYGTLNFPAGEGILNLTAKFKQHGNCKGYVTVRNCTMAPATLAYHIVIANRTIALDSGYTYDDDRLIKYANTSDSRVHGGVWLTLKDQFTAESTMRWAGAVGYDMKTTGITALRYSRRAKATSAAQCLDRWLDPTHDILMSARELMFRLALQGNNSGVAAQLIHATQQGTDVVYTSDSLFLGLALMLIGLAAVAVAPLLMHWWRLGRDVSLSPIEIARAFGAPELMGSGSNLNAGRLIKDIGSREIQYGVVSCRNSNPHQEHVWSELMFAHPSVVQAPRKGEQY